MGKLLRMGFIINEMGNKYAMLTVLSRARNNHSGHYATWLCRCDCGKEKIVTSSNLRLGRVRNCGCLRSISKLGKKTGPRPNRKGIRVAIATEFKKGLIPAGGFETRFKKGPDHLLWKGGITSEHNLIRHGRKYKQWRNAVYFRDRFHCQRCQKHCEEKNIVAHHVKSFTTHEHLRFIVNNGITLCRSCHLNLHKEEDKRSCALVI